MTVQVVESYEDFIRLEPRWAEIAKAGGVRTPFQSFAWLNNWLTHRGEGTSPFTLVLENDHTIAPLGLVNFYGIRILRLLGTGDSDYPGLVTLLPLDKAWDRVAEELAQRRDAWDLLHLHSVRERDAIIPALEHHMGYYKDRPYEVCPLVMTNRSWEALLADRKKLRPIIRRWDRRLEELGKPTVHVVQPPVPDILINELVEVEHASWKWHSGDAIFRSSSRRNFLEAILRDPRLPVQLWLLRLSGKLIAFELMLTDASRWYGYMAVYRKDCRNAGSYLLAKVIESACCSNCECVDLLRGDEDYKLAWTNVISQVYEIVCPSGLLGRGAVRCYQARWQAAKIPIVRRLRNLLVKTGDRR